MGGGAISPVSSYSALSHPNIVTLRCLAKQPDIAMAQRLAIFAPLATSGDGAIQATPEVAARSTNTGLQSNISIPDTTTFSPAHLASSMPHLATPPHGVAISTIFDPLATSGDSVIQVTPEAVAGSTIAGLQSNTSIPDTTAFSPAHLASSTPLLATSTHGVAMSTQHLAMPPQSFSESDPFSAASSFTELLHSNDLPFSGFSDAWNGTFAPASLQGPPVSGPTSSNYMFPMGPTFPTSE